MKKRRGTPLNLKSLKVSWYQDINQSGKDIFDEAVGGGDGVNDAEAGLDLLKAFLDGGVDHSLAGSRKPKEKILKFQRHFWGHSLTNAFHLHVDNFDFKAVLEIKDELREVPSNHKAEDEEHHGGKLPEVLGPEEQLREGTDFRTMTHVTLQTSLEALDSAIRASFIDSHKNVSY